jgi:hypothetical protein
MEYPASLPSSSIEISLALITCILSHHGMFGERARLDADSHNLAVSMCVNPDLLRAMHPHALRPGETLTAHTSNPSKFAHIRRC